MERWNESKNDQGTKQVALADRLAAEGELFGSLPDKMSTSLQDRLRGYAERPEDLAKQAVQFGAFGCAVGLIAKNPAMFGESVAPYVVSIQRYAGPVLAAAAGIDLGHRVAEPAAATWTNPRELERAQHRLATNLSNAIVDYSVAGTAGGIGCRLSGPLAAKLDLAANATRTLPLAHAAESSGIPGADRALPRTDSASSEDFLLRKSWFERGDAPKKIALTGKLHTNPYIKDAEYKRGDLALHAVEDGKPGQTRGLEGMRYFLRMFVGGTVKDGWRNADLYEHLRPLFYGMNAPHLATRYPILKNIVEANAGKELHWLPGNQWGYRPQFKLALPKDFPKAPNEPVEIGKISIGRERPKKGAEDRYPLTGDLWIKQVEHGVGYDGKHYGEIQTRFCDGNSWRPVSQDAFSRVKELNRFKFDSLEEARELASIYKTLLNDSGAFVQPSKIKYVIGGHGKKFWRAPYEFGFDKKS